MEHAPLSAEELAKLDWSDMALEIIADERGARAWVQDGWRAEDRRARLSLTPDERSRVGRHGDVDTDGPDRVTLSNLRMDLEWDL